MIVHCQMRVHCFSNLLDIFWVRYAKAVVSHIRSNVLLSIQLQLIDRA